MKTLAELTKGDLVILDNGRFHHNTVEKIESVTHAMIELKGMFFSIKRDGRYHKGHGHHGMRIHVPKNGEIDAVLAGLKKIECVNKLYSTKWHTLPMETLESITLLLP